MQKLYLCCLFIISVIINSSHAENPLKPFQIGSLTEIERHYAKQSFLLSFWSIDCPPCIKEFELIQRIRTDHPDINVVLVSTDQVSFSAQAFTVLEKFALTDVENWIFAEDFVERLRYEVDPNWIGSIPQSYFYTRDGHRTGIAGALHLKHFEEWLFQDENIRLGK